MKENGLIDASVYGLNESYIKSIKEILAIQKLTSTQIYDAIMRALTPDVVELVYDDDLSEIVNLLDKFTDLSDLHLLKLALEVKNVLLIKEIVEYVTIEDEELLQFITDLDVF
jgi:hypothetical protein